MFKSEKEEEEKKNLKNFSYVLYQYAMFLFICFHYKIIWSYELKDFNERKDLVFIYIHNSVRYVV